MDTYYKSFKYRIYPSSMQASFFEKTFRACIFTYNKLLEVHEDEKRKTPASLKDEFPFLKQVDSVALCYKALALEQAFRNHKRGLAGPPQTQKYSGTKSYSTIVKDIRNNGIRLPKVGWVKTRFKKQRPIEGRIKKVTISLTPAGEYYASVLCEIEKKKRMTHPTKNPKKTPSE